MILHCVFCELQATAVHSDVQDLFTELRYFALSLKGVIGFDFGPNRDFEGKSQVYSEGFVIRFMTKAALDEYAKHPKHIALGQRLCSLCNGGSDGIMVFDLETS